MLLSAICLALVSFSLAEKCDVTCKRGVYPTVKAQQCVCSPGYSGRYGKGEYCAVRLSVNKARRVRLEVSNFRFRPWGKCALDGLSFRNMYNSKRKGYFIKKVCKREQLHKKKAIIINSPQVRMSFRSSKRGKKTANKKWRVCLRDPYSPNHDSMTCPIVMDNMEKGFNIRHANISSDATSVTSFCCTATSLDSVDDAYLACEKGESPKEKITANDQEVCVRCSSLKKKVSVQADIVEESSAKKISCSCSVIAGVAIGEDCTGDLPCLDTNDHAYCDASNTCVCPDGMIADPTNKYCNTAVAIGESCANGELCNSTYGRASCDGSTCVCPATFAPDSKNEYCTKDVAIGADCSNGLGCIDSLSRATCVSDVCTCPSGTRASSANTYCAYRSAYNGFCENTLDCVATRSQNCDTVNKKCACESKYTYFKNFCSYKSNLGGICQYTADCGISNSFCSGSKCTCTSNYKQRSSTLCAPVCKQLNGNKYYAGTIVCNKKGKTCNKCKCNNPPRKLSKIKSKKKNCNNLGCSKTTKIKKGNACGS